MSIVPFAPRGHLDCVFPRVSHINGHLASPVGATRLIAKTPPERVLRRSAGLLRMGAGEVMGEQLRFIFNKVFGKILVVQILDAVESF